MHFSDCFSRENRCTRCFRFLPCRKYVRIVVACHRSKNTGFQKTAKIDFFRPFPTAMATKCKISSGGLFQNFILWILSILVGLNKPWKWQSVFFLILNVSHPLRQYPFRWPVVRFQPLCGAFWDRFRTFVRNSGLMCRKPGFCAPQAKILAAWRSKH